jgi:hypothetical protein
MEEKALLLDLVVFAIAFDLVVIAIATAMVTIATLVSSIDVTTSLHFYVGLYSIIPTLIFSSILINMSHLKLDKDKLPHMENSKFKQISLMYFLPQNKILTKFANLIPQIKMKEKTL